MPRISALLPPKSEAPALLLPNQKQQQKSPVIKIQAQPCCGPSVKRIVSLGFFRKLVLLKNVIGFEPGLSGNRYPIGFRSWIGFKFRKRIGIDCGSEGRAALLSSVFCSLVVRTEIDTTHLLGRILVRLRESGNIKLPALILPKAEAEYA